jgi:hypothetical protein
MKYSIIGSGIVGQAINRQESNSQIFTRTSLVPADHDILVIAAPTGNRLVVNHNPTKDIEDCNQIINFVQQSKYNQLVYISTIDVYRDHPYGNNRRYLEHALDKLPNSHIVRLPSLIDNSVNKNILYDLKNQIWLDKICLDSEIQWYPLKRLGADIKQVIDQDIKYQNLFSAPISNQNIVARFFPNLIKQLTSNQLVSVKYDFYPYAIPVEEIWQSFEEFFIDFPK